MVSARACFVRRTEAALNLQEGGRIYPYTLLGEDLKACIPLFTLYFLTLLSPRYKSR